MPQPEQPSREDVEAAIHTAFAGVRLGGARSLRQAEAIALADEPDGGRTDGAQLPPEVTDDWSAVPASELYREGGAYLDAQGLRYYLPALMLRLLDDYELLDGFIEPGEPWIIGTIMALDQRHPGPPGFLELLSAPQRRAIALYVRALPGLVDLGPSASARVTRAFRDVWSRDLADDN